jgi:hypothetical protein
MSEGDRNFLVFLAIFWFFSNFIAILSQFPGNFSDYLSAIARNIPAKLPKNRLKFST